jgi:hypothetical protein
VTIKIKRVYSKQRLNIFLPEIKAANKKRVTEETKRKRVCEGWRYVGSENVRDYIELCS